MSVCVHNASRVTLERSLVVREEVSARAMLVGSDMRVSVRDP